MNVIGLDGKPKIYDLKTLLLEWLKFRFLTVRKRLEFRLNEVESRLHILAGLMIVYLNLDEVIRIIREQEKPKEKLIKKFKLTDLQAESISNLRLRNLAKLEEQKIQLEKDDLESEQKSLAKLLASKKEINQLIQKEILEDAKEFGDDRRTKFNEEAETSQAFDETQLASNTKLPRHYFLDAVSVLSFAFVKVNKLPKIFTALFLAVAPIADNPVASILAKRGFPVIVKTATLVDDISKSSKSLLLVTTTLPSKVEPAATDF
jgi:hypothetical protein